MSIDPLTRLADVDVPAARPDLAGVERRARAQRRGRRTRLTASTAALAAVLAFGGVVVPRLGTQEPGADAAALSLGVAPARADDSGKQCDVGRGDWVERATWAEDPRVAQAAVLLADAPWPLTSAGAHRDTMNCPPALPAAVLLDPDPLRGITVWADVADPFPASVEDEVMPIAVRGSEGRFRDLGTGMFVSWVDVDGVRWLASGSGMTAEALVAALDALRFDGLVFAASSVPQGFDVVPVSDAPADPVTVTWWVTYGDTTSQVLVDGPDGGAYGWVPGGGVDLQVTVSAQAPPEVTASYWAAETVLVDVDGRRAVYAPPGEPAADSGGDLVWQTDGVTYRLTGALPQEQLVALARSVEAIDVDDPRLSGVRAQPEG
jgi:hypothetical protein